LPLELVDGIDETDVQRIWRRIRVHTPQRERRARWPLALAAGVAAACLLASSLLLRGLRSAPLRLASGELPAVFALEDGARLRRVALADGSQVVVRPGTRLEVIANQADRFLTALRRGSVRFDVRPGGARRWIIECGPVAVEVVGTEFEVERAPDHVEVSVERGVVVVRGNAVPDGVQRLAAGEHLRVAIEPTEGNGPKLAGAITPSPMAPSASTSQGPPGGPNALASGTGALAPSPRADLDDLMRRADAARRSGDSAVAARLLEQAVERARGAPAGGVAALTLARLVMASDPARAARALSRALAQGMPRGLEEDARARLVEARASCGDREGAREAARAYEERFPAGAYLEEIHRRTAD
jgi:transmembrane sensor